MRINNANDAKDFVESLRNKSIKAQSIQLVKAIETTELNQMYYEQKGSERGVIRTEECLTILKNYRTILQID